MIKMHIDTNNPFNSTPLPTMTPPPAPPERVYTTSKLAKDAMHEFARAHGYAMVLKRSKPDKVPIEERTKFFFYCDRFNKYESKATVRSTSSLACGCAFRVNIRQFMEGVTPLWDLTVIDGTHNHEPTHDPSSHGVFRRQDRAVHEETLK
jgi:hypothetical protein